jgi:hypothetical protein
VGYLDFLPSEAKQEGRLVRRFEVFTGSGRRRRWSTAEKTAIARETYAIDATVSLVAVALYWHGAVFNAGAQPSAR